jgi:hypothetical protein
MLTELEFILFTMGCLTAAYGAAIIAIVVAVCAPLVAAAIVRRIITRRQHSRP